MKRTLCLLRIQFLRPFNENICCPSYVTSELLHLPGSMLLQNQPRISRQVEVVQRAEQPKRRKTELTKALKVRMRQREMASQIHLSQHLPLQRAKTTLLMLTLWIQRSRYSRQSHLHQNNNLIHLFLPNYSIKASMQTDSEKFIWSLVYECKQRAKDHKAAFILSFCTKQCQRLFINDLKALVLSPQCHLVLPSLLQTTSLSFFHSLPVSTYLCISFQSTQIIPKFFHLWLQFLTKLSNCSRL